MDKRKPVRPCKFSEIIQILQSMRNNDKKEEPQMIYRESDSLIVLMIAGNAAGEKEAT
jgi:hypothetical protein